VLQPTIATDRCFEEATMGGDGSTPPAVSDETGYARFGAATGVISLISDVASLFEHGRKAVTEYRSFDQTSMAYIVRFAREIARIEVWCQSLGCRLGPEGRISRPVMLAEPLQAAQSRGKLATIEVRLAEVGSLLKDIIATFDAIGNARIEAVSGFLDDLDRKRPGLQPTPGIPDLESGGIGGSTIQTMDQLGKLLRDAGILPEPAPWTDKMKRIASRTHPHLERMLFALDHHSTALEFFVDRQMIGALYDTIPVYLSRFDRVESGHESIRRDIEGVHSRLDTVQQEMAALFSVYEGAKGTDPAVEEATMMSAMTLMLLRGDVKLADGLAGTPPDISEANLEFEDEDSMLTTRRQVVRLRPLQKAAHLLELNLYFDLSGTSRNQKQDMDRLWDRLRNLTGCLRVCPERFRVLKAVNAATVSQGCDRRWGILYELPPGFDPSKHTVVSLRELLFSRPPDCICSCQPCGECTLRQNHKSPSPMPPLGRRFRLATILIKAFRLFQTSHWLHQSICSDSIIFIHNNPPPAATPTIDQPWIVGFDFARNIKDGSDRRKDKPKSMDYQHPLRHNVGADGLQLWGFRAEFDIYAIGRLLLEIALWEVVDSPESAEEELDRLPELVGEGYSNAVRWCLGQVEGSPMEEEKIKATHPRDRGPWPEFLIRMFDLHVGNEILRCRA